MLFMTSEAVTNIHFHGLKNTNVHFYDFSHFLRPGEHPLHQKYFKL